MRRCSTRSVHGVPLRLSGNVDRGNPLQPARVGETVATNPCGDGGRSVWWEVSGGTPRGMCRGDGQYLFPHPRRLTRHGQRRPPPRTADMPQEVRRGRGDSRRRCVLALAFEVLANGIHPPAVAAACCAALGEAAGPRHLVGGQADDIRGGACMASIPGAGPESGVVAEDRQAPQAGLEAIESVHAQDRRDDPGLGATGRIDRGGRRRTDVGIGAIRPACGAGISNR